MFVLGKNYHCSPDVITTLKPVRQPDGAYLKPSGFWYFVYQGQVPVVQPYVYEVFLPDSFVPWSRVDWKEDYSNSILRLVPGDIPSFSKYCCEEGVPRWHWLQDRFGGIEFSEYKTGLDTTDVWYYSVDYTSGCIWNPPGVGVWTKLLSPEA